MDAALAWWLKGNNETWIETDCENLSLKDSWLVFETTIPGSRVEFVKDPAGIDQTVQELVSWLKVKGLDHSKFKHTMLRLGRWMTVTAVSVMVKKGV